MGAFDDLIPSQGGGMFDDLVPQQPSPAQQIQVQTPSRPIGDIQAEIRTAQPLGDVSKIKPLIEELQSHPDFKQPDIRSILEPAATIATSAIAEPVAGLAGLAQTINPLASPGAGRRAVEGTREALTFQPRSPAGKEALQALGETLEPIGKALETSEKFLGGNVLDITGSPLLAATAASIPTAALEALGGIAAFKQAGKIPQSALKQKVAGLIEAGEPDNITAKFISSGAGKVKGDSLAKSTIKQGFDPGVIAAIKGSSPKDRRLLRKMLGIHKKGKENAKFAATNRPSDVIGDSVLDRFKSVVSSNKEAGKRLDSVAASLKGKEVDFKPAVDSFIDDLESLGVKIGDDLKPRFSGSDIEGLDAPQNAIKRLFSRMAGGKVIDAHDVHRLKRFIDENVTFGKSKEGLGGRTERSLKSLRRNLDQALDSTFPEYNKVNTKYSDTINALDSFKEAAGSKFNPLSDNADKFVGTLSRRLLSNAQSRVTLIDSLKELQDVAVKYGGKFEDDILTQAIFADELSRLFGSAAKTSFEGGIEKAVSTAVGRRGIIEVGADAAVSGIKKLRGVNEQNAIKAIDQLLKR